MTTPISVLAVTKSTGGTAFYNQTLLAGLEPEHFRSHTICLSENAPAYSASLQAIGLGAEQISMSRYRIDLVGDFKAFRRIHALAASNAFDVILCHGSKAGFMARLAGWLSRTPTIYCQASLPFLRRIQGWKSTAYGALEILARGFGGHIVSLTQSARDATMRRHITSADASSVIRTGIDTDRFRPKGRRDAAVTEMGLDPSRPVVGWIGRFEPQKAPMEYLAALELVVRKHPDAQFVIAGEGAQLQDMKERISATGLTSAVHLLGWQDDPVKTFEAFDIFAMTSRWEGLPLTLLEAMAMGVVPVSTDVDGCAEVIRDGIDGRLVPAGDPQAMADALDDLLERDDLDTMKSRARDRIEFTFNQQRMISEWAALLRRLCRKERHAPVVREYQ